MNFEQFEELLRKELLGEEKIGNEETVNELGAFLNTVRNSYVLVKWPDVQEYMEEEWFDQEAILAEDSSYLIPITRL